MMKTPTTSCRTCGYVQVQNESYIRCLECGNRLLPLLHVPAEICVVSEGNTPPLLEEDILPSPLISEDKQPALDLSGFKQLLPFLHEMFRSEQETKLQQILDRLGLMEQLQVKLSQVPEVHVYMPEQSSPPLHETVVNIPHPAPMEARKVVKIVERDERGLIVKITEQDQEQEEEQGEN